MLRLPYMDPWASSRIAGCIDFISTGKTRTLLLDPAIFLQLIEEKRTLTGYTYSLCSRSFRLVYPVAKAQSPASSQSLDLPESPHPPRRLPPNASPALPPSSSQSSLLENTTNTDRENSGSDITALPFISRHGHGGSENTNQHVRGQEDGVAAHYEDRVDEIQQKVEQGMTL